MTHPRSRTRSRRLLALVVVPLAAALAVTACAGDDTPAAAGGEGAGGAASSGGHGHGSKSPYGSSMAPDLVTAEQVAELGDGPGVGDAWNGWFGLNVCGRFLEPVPAALPAVDGFTTPGDGTYRLAPTVEGSGTGHTATVGKLLEVMGISTATGRMTLPTSVSPATLDLGPVGADGSDRTVAGSTLETGDRCGTARAEVQLWVYDANAVETGKDVRLVVTDPQDVPVVEDGMALVLALAPEWSLPTLPPSALVTPG